jgi:holliday junction DNA helicase RuvA
MIGRLTGILAEKNPPTILIDVSGVGYNVSVPMSSFYDLPELGAKVQLMIHMIVREDAQLLYGFLRANEREAFQQLIKISGIGPRTALAVLSGMSVDELAQAIALQESARLTRVPGIGKKTAERLLLELKGKLAPALGSTGTPVNDHQGDIVQALIALGYSEKEALLAVRALAADVSVSDGIKHALRNLAK